MSIELLISKIEHLEKAKYWNSTIIIEQKIYYNRRLRLLRLPIY